MIYYCKYTLQANGLLLGISETTDFNDDYIKCKSPKSLLVNEPIRVQISRDKEKWVDKIAPSTYLTLYIGPKINKIKPAYGNANKRGKKYLTILGKNFKCLTKGCKNLKCKFIFKLSEFKNDSIYKKGIFISENKMKCLIPFFNRPETVSVEISLNNRDYTNNKVIFTYFDPFIFSFNPAIISSESIKIFKIVIFFLIFFYFKASSEVLVRGYGFANTKQILYKIGENSSNYLCNNKKCVFSAKSIILCFFC